MKVSIIIPVFNQAEYLDVCLSSALAQSYHDFEVIVVDDGSTDDSWKVASQYPVQVIRQTNQGQRFKSGGPARNIGIRAAKGELLLPLDGDDWIEPTYLEKTIPLMKDRVGIVATNMHRFGAMEDVIPAQRVTLGQELMYNVLPVTSLLRKDAVNEVGGYWPFGWEDWNLWLKLLKAGWLVDVVNEPLFHYRVKPGGLNTDQTNMREKLTARMREYHPEFGRL